MRCPLPAALAASLLLVLSAAVPPAGAEDDALGVATEFVSHLDRASTGRPSDLVADLDASGTVPLGPTPPPGTGAVPPGATAFGQVPWGASARTVALGAGDGGRAVLAVDVNGDGSLRGPDEVAEILGRSSRVEGRVSTRWRFPSVVRGTMKLDVTFQQVAHTFNAVLIAGEPTPLVLSESPPAGCSPVPVAGHIRYAVVPARAGPLTVAFVRGANERLTVLADVNRNGTLGDGSETFAAPVQARDPGATIWQTGEVNLGDGPIAFAYQELAARALATWKLAATGARRGTVKVGGVDFALHLLDGDFDGQYTSAADWWWFGPQARLGRFTRLLPVSMIEANEAFYLPEAWRLISVDPQGHAVVMKDLGAPHPNAYLYRRTEAVNRTRWFPRFQQGHGFEQKWMIDASRPRAAAVPHWLHDVTLTEALRRARAENKPLLVDFEADWCTNCKRWDYHVYADAEVARLLAGFVLLKVNVDFNVGDDITRLGGKNPPYLIFLDGNGKALLSFPEVDRTLKPTGGQLPGLTYFQRPTDFVQTVQAAAAEFQRRK